RSKSIPPPRTHNLRILLDLIATVVDLPASVDEAAILTDYAVMTRYPGDFEPVSQDEHEVAIQLARRVVDWAEAEI
ncbi:MAG: HEPN domain-containing protein, partial [Syntrophotaleaceae bacterium]